MTCHSLSLSLFLLPAGKRNKKMQKVSERKRGRKRRENCIHIITQADVSECLPMGLHTRQAYDILYLHTNSKCLQHIYS